MTRRRLLLFGLLSGATVVMLLALWLLSPRRAITRENYDKINKGMPRDDVEAILGAPDQIRDEPLLYRWIKVARGIPPAWACLDRHFQPDPDAQNVRTASWYSLEVMIIIEFDDNDCVCGVRYLAAFDPSR